LRALSHEGSAGFNLRHQQQLSQLQRVAIALPMDQLYTEIETVELQALIDHLRSFSSRLSAPFRDHAEDYLERLIVYNRELRELHARVH
jgi:hypothetical protein